MTLLGRRSFSWPEKTETRWRKAETAPEAAGPGPAEPRSVEGTMRRFVGASGAGGDAASPSSKAEASWPGPTRQEIRKVAWNWRTKPSPPGPTAPTPTFCWPNTLPAARKRSVLYEKGVAAGERAVGAEAFRRDEGHFWLVLETRPYMRARLGLAHVLWTLGRREEAVGHLQDLLRLNPGDNQGVRYTLAGFLLFLDRDDDTGPTPPPVPRRRLRGLGVHAGAAGLPPARRHDRRPAAAQGGPQVQQARPGLSAGGEIPVRPAAALLSARRRDRKPSNTSAVSWRDGSPRRARSPGCGPTPCRETKKPATPEPKGPLAAVKTWLNKRLPQEDDVWQADFRRLSNWIVTDGGDRFGRGWSS